MVKNGVPGSLVGICHHAPASRLQPSLPPPAGRPVTEVADFGAIVLVVAGGFVLALASTKLTRILRIPAPALFLLVAAVASDLWPRLGEAVSLKTVERLATVALIVILFDGGMHIGWKRMRRAAVPVLTVGVIGTFGTAALMAMFSHWLLGVSWIVAGIIGAALAPTDPAVMFSVLGDKEIGGRSGTVLEGESGANDPVGIALMIGMIELALHPGGSFAIVVKEFAIEMAIGLAIGWVAARVLLPLLRRAALPDATLHPLGALAAAGVVYGVTSVAHGSGFLAVFVAGILIGDERAPYKADIERFAKSMASLAEVVVFVALGLTIDVSSLGRDHLWRDGIMLGLLLAFLVRPLVVGALLLPVRLRWGERLFVMWGGLKGAVPILLGAFAVLAGVDQADRVYGIIFVVVALSVLMQGSTMPLAARLLGVPMRPAESSHWQFERYAVGAGSRAAGLAVRDLPLGEGGWVQSVERGGVARRPRDSTVIEDGDVVVVLAPAGAAGALGRYFGGDASG